MAGPVACGGDDDDGNNGGIDAAAGGIDAAAIDAAGNIDAGAIDAAELGDAAVGGGPLGGYFLLTLQADAGTLGTITLRALATVFHEPTTKGGIAGTLDITLEGLYAPECNKAMSGELVPNARLDAPGIAVNEAGEFTFTINDAVIPPGVVGNATACGLMATSDLSATGSVFDDKTNATCGEATVDVSLPVDLPPVTGTFGTVRLDEPVMLGDANLPTAVSACPPAVN